MNTNQKSPMTRNSQALTFVELLWVIAIVFAVILIVSMLPHRHNRERILRVMDMSHLRQIGIAMVAYSVDHDGKLPGHPKDVTQYLGDPSRIKEVYINPYQEKTAVIDRGDFEGTATRFGGYVFLNLGLDLDDVEKPSELILAYTAKVTSKQTTRSVQFADGHVEQWDEERLRAAMPEGVDVDALDGP